MSWAAAVMLLLGCLFLGATLGAAIGGRVRRGLLVVATTLPGLSIFAPWRCASSISSTSVAPLGGPEQLAGRTSCETLYGVRLPEIASISGETAGSLLVLLSASIASTAGILVARYLRSRAAGSGCRSS